MPLVTSIQQARDTGLKIMFTNNMTTLADMKAAERKYLSPILGKELLAAMIKNPGDPLYAELLPIAQRAEAHLAYWLDLPSVQVQIGDGGLSTFENNNRQAAHRWEYLELRESLADKGCEALEELLELLHDNAAKFNWQLPVSYKSFFISGKDFARYFTIYQPYRTFENFRPIVIQVEDQYIKTTIGEEQFLALLNTTEPTALESKAITLIKKAIAHFTITQAVELLPVKISSAGFTVLLTESNDTPNGTEQQAPANLLSLMLKSTDKMGNAYLTQLKGLLDSNASTEVFPGYFNSPYYTAPVVPDPETDTSPNANRKLFAL